jgi:hypothetical protein
MVRHLRGLAPPDRQRCVGLNLLDMTLGLDVDKCGGGSQSCDPRDLIGLGEALWSKYWGPRMEAVWRSTSGEWRWACRSGSTRSWTCLHCSWPLETGGNLFYCPTCPWTHLMDRTCAGGGAGGTNSCVRSSLQQDVISPVLTRVFRLSGNSSSRSVFGQAVSTLNLREVLRQGSILLVHTATGELGDWFAPLCG